MSSKEEPTAASTATKPRRKWDRDAMLKACEDVRAKKMSCRQAAKVYGLPVTTLNDYVNERHSTVDGSPTVINRVEEELLVELIYFMNDIGFRLYNQEVIQVVFSYLKATKQTDLFKNGYPGKEWVYGFRKRHSLPSYTDVLVEKNEIMDAWLKKVEADYEINDFHARPLSIFKCEEVGLGCEQGKCEILLRNSVASNPITNELAADSKKDLYSMLVCANACGDFMPVNVIYKGERRFIGHNIGTKQWCSFY